MESDGYSLFTDFHRPYLQGVRHALRDRLESVYGSDWFRRGVLPAVSPRQRENLSYQLRNMDLSDLSVILDPAHFERIIARNHAAAFADAFPEVDTVQQRLRFLATVRNDWAHISPEGLTMPRVIAAIQEMKRILVALRRREAAEIDTMMRQQGVSDQETELPSDLPAAELSDDERDQPDDMVAPALEWWRTLRSYLVAECFIAPESPLGRNGARLAGQVIVAITISNIAPVGADRPYVCFENVRLEVTGGSLWDGNGEYGYRDGAVSVKPGESVGRQYLLAQKQLAHFDFGVTGQVEIGRFFSVQHNGGLPREVVRPILDELSQRFEAIGVKDFLNNVLESMKTIEPTMPLSYVARVREDLGQSSQFSQEKRNALGNLFAEFQLNPDAPLGSQCYEIVRLLVEFEKRVQEVDAAIGDTNMAAIQQAVDNVEQLQLSVLQVEETIRRMLSGHPPGTLG